MNNLLGMLVSAAAIAALLQPAIAEDLTAAEIANRLAPKTSLTRGLAPQTGLNQRDAALIDSMTGLTRSITLEERTALAPVIANANLPQVDLSIEFEFDSAEVTPAAIVTLLQLGTALESEGLAKSVFVFAGHTDSKGSAAYNQGLSEQRALAVKAFMAEAFGIDPIRMIAAGFGEEQPANPGDPEAPENRRVSIVNVSH